MLSGNDCLKMHTNQIFLQMKQAQELRAASGELERVTAELRRTKIGILKNGSQRDKINLLIEERLQELENEERLYTENLERQIELLKSQLTEREDKGE